MKQLAQASNFALRRSKKQQKYLLRQNNEAACFDNDKPQTAQVTRQRRSIQNGRASSIRSNELLNDRSASSIEQSVAAATSSQFELLKKQQYSGTLIHDVQVKPMNIYDSKNMTMMSFPLKPSDMQSESVAPSTVSKPTTSQPNNPNKASDIFIIRQIEKDINRFKEDILASNLQREKRPKPLTAEDEQKQNEVDFQEAMGDIRKLGKCFWRFPQVEPVINAVITNLSQIIERNKRQLMLILRQV